MRVRNRHNKYGSNKWMDSFSKHVAIRKWRKTPEITASESCTCRFFQILKETTYRPPGAARTHSRRARGRKTRRAPASSSWAGPIRTGPTERCCRRQDRVDFECNSPERVLVNPASSSVTTNPIAHRLAACQINRKNFNQTVRSRLGRIILAALRPPAYLM